ncbi:MULTISPECIES: hypothetical protein [unclassified Arcicella]|uniref:hypothetical protein n=1 Tax=unclassified Arcicella TaxID=2644986 RepID=UPI00285A633E|nr:MULTISPECIES: hypothetical protein [unclassified Arcicella]MDR6562858.1 hypothetical protein [Arcicella sp. BE51]MDR6812801.1 hypothetical protein [Arcicella sp. BE140]MDR6824113.1 hypothetical protein [Arcicella sp. BE139]
MPVPDITYFGEKPEGGGIQYGEVRQIIDEQRKLLILKGRIDTLLIGQIDQLCLTNDDGNLKVYSPFPLTVLTLLSIETLGHIINDIDKIKEANDYEQSKAIVTPVYQLMDTKLSYKPSKDFYKSFEKLHGKDDKKSIKKYSDVIHKYQRNTFNHGYQSRGVFLTETINQAITIDNESGCLYINPYSFWELYKTTQDYVFEQILNSKRKEWRQNALKYFQRLIS